MMGSSINLYSDSTTTASAYTGKQKKIKLFNSASKNTGLISINMYTTAPRPITVTFSPAFRNVPMYTNGGRSDIDEHSGWIDIGTPGVVPDVPQQVDLNSSFTGQINLAVNIRNVLRLGAGLTVPGSNCQTDGQKALFNFDKNIFSVNSINDTGATYSYCAARIEQKIPFNIFGEISFLNIYDVMTFSLGAQVEYRQLFAERGWVYHINCWEKGSQIMSNTKLMDFLPVNVYLKTNYILNTNIEDTKQSYELGIYTGVQHPGIYMPTAEGKKEGISMDRTLRWVIGLSATVLGD